VAQGSLEFGVLTFNPADRDLSALTIGTDELVMLLHPSHPLATRRSVGIEDVGRLTIVAHNDPSPARERVLRLFETRRVPLNILIALPSLDGIKRAVEMQLGVALLPRRCAVAEIADGRLVAVPVTPVSRIRPLKLIYRRGVQLSHAAAAFLEAAQEAELVTAPSPKRPPRRGRRQDALNPDM
jgi:DNA-binding transcriptional LysR family regulator